MMQKNIIGVDNRGLIETAFDNKDWFNEPIKVTEKATYTISGRIDHNCTKVYAGGRGQIAQVVWMGNSFSPTVKFTSAGKAATGFFMLRSGKFAYKSNDPEKKGYIIVTDEAVVKRLDIFFKTIVKKIAEIKGKAVPEAQAYSSAYYEESWGNLMDEMEKQAAYREAAKNKKTE